MKRLASISIPFFFIQPSISWYINMLMFCLIVSWQVNSILRHVGELLEYDDDEKLENLYKKTAWHFDLKLKKPGACFDVFKHAVK